MRPRVLSQLICTRAFVELEKFAGSRDVRTFMKSNGMGSSPPQDNFRVWRHQNPRRRGRCGLSQWAVAASVIGNPGCQLSYHTYNTA